jgi:hypothetical protein
LADDLPARMMAFETAQPEGCSCGEPQYGRMIHVHALFHTAAVLSYIDDETLGNLRVLLLQQNSRWVDDEHATKHFAIWYLGLST